MKTRFLFAAILFTCPAHGETQMAVVQQGENLVAVAQRCGTTTQDLIKTNGLQKPYKIYIGQPLKYNKADPVKSPVIKSTPSISKTIPIEPRNEPAEVPAAPQEVKTPIELKRTHKHFSWPIEGKIISGFGKKKLGLKNDGINIEAKFQSPVKAAEDGIVAYAGNEIRGFGNLILIKHGENWSTAYAHNDILQVAKGDTVKRGQVIAKSGNTGHVDTPQVHFELRHKSKPVDPLKHLK